MKKSFYASWKKQVSIKIKYKDRDNGWEIWETAIETIHIVKFSFKSHHSHAIFTFPHRNKTVSIALAHFKVIVNSAEVRHLQIHRLQTLNLNPAIQPVALAGQVNMRNVSKKVRKKTPAFISIFIWIYLYAMK